MAETVFDPLIQAQGAFVGFVGDTVWNMILYVIGIVLYSIFIWHFYKFIARRDVFGWDTEKYERSGALGKLASGFVYFIKYLIAFPILVFVWFGVFAVFMFVLGKTLSVESILLTSFALVTAIRVCAYYNEDLSNDLAKMVPLALLGVYIIQPTFLEVDTVVDKVFGIWQFIVVALQFTAFSVAAEWFLRIVWGIKQRIAPHSHSGNHKERFGR